MPVDRPAPVRPSRRRGADSGRTAKQRVGLVLLVAGLVVFFASAIGARAGFTVLPFDPHHVIGQLGGLAFALLGAGLRG